MRRFIASALLIGLAMTARALDAPELEVAPEGGFHPRGSDFRVTFHFADMQPSRTPMTTGWSGAEGWRPGWNFVASNAHWVWAK